MEVHLEEEIRSPTFLKYLQERYSHNYVMGQSCEDNQRVYLQLPLLEYFITSPTAFPNILSEVSLGVP